MILKEFIKKLQNIANKKGGSLEVVMADGMEVVKPLYLKDFMDKKVVVITDQ